jgi:hypothetical protein
VVSNTFRHGLPPILLALASLGVWELYARIAALPVTILPTPSRVLTAGLGSIGLLAWHASQTLVETLAGFALAVLVAVVCAAAIDFFLVVRRALLPLLVISQTVPIVALAPLLVLWFGYGALPKVLVVALVCFFPMVVSATRGFRAASPSSLDLMRVLGARPNPSLRQEGYPWYVKFSINGFVHGSMPLSELTLRKGEHVRWYLMASTNDFDFHAPHWHGNTVILNGMRTDVAQLSMMQMSTADMVPDNVGIWLFHCHVSFHNEEGMAVRYRVTP